MHAKLKTSGICTLMVAAMLWMTSPVECLTTAARFTNGSHLYDYLYGGGGGDHSARQQHAGADSWHHLIHLFNAVAFNTGGQQQPRGVRIRRQAAQPQASLHSQSERGPRYLYGLHDYQTQDGGTAEATEQEKESLAFLGDLAFAFPLVTLDIPFTGIQIPMFDYDSRDYYD